MSRKRAGKSPDCGFFRLAGMLSDKKTTMSIAITPKDRKMPSKMYVKFWSGGSQYDVSLTAPVSRKHEKINIFYRIKIVMYYAIVLKWTEYAFLQYRNNEYEDNVIQCVPIKRKPVLSVRYIHCHARFNQTMCFIIEGIFSSFIWYQTHDDISMHDWKETI